MAISSKKLLFLFSLTLVQLKSKPEICWTIYWYYRLYQHIPFILSFPYRVNLFRRNKIKLRILANMFIMACIVVGRSFKFLHETFLPDSWLQYTLFIDCFLHCTWKWKWLPKMTHFPVNEIFTSVHPFSLIWLIHGHAGARRLSHLS